MSIDAHNAKHAAPIKFIRRDKTKMARTAPAPAPCKLDSYGAQSADMEQAGEQAWVQAVGIKGLSSCQHADRVMAVQAFADGWPATPEIPDARTLSVQLLTKACARHLPRKSGWQRQFRKRLFKILGLTMNLRSRGHGRARAQGRSGLRNHSLEPLSTCTEMRAAPSAANAAWQVVRAWHAHAA